PLIYALRHSDKTEQNKIKTILKSSKKRSVRSSEVIEFVMRKGGLDYSATVAEGFADKALESIARFPESDAKRSLQLLVDFVMKRQH
ncbi:MAG: polyprenyl synthetase family protein, partial [Chlorobaculum sp.]|nr:polyprenyl synthetase family protein [Chlorobaculum sp.]